MHKITSSGELMISTDKKIIGSFLFALLSIALIMFLSYDSGRNYIKNNILVEHTHDVILQLEMLRSAVVESESNSRGYVITHNYAFLDQFSNKINDIDSIRDRLFLLISDNSEQTEKLRALVPVIQKKCDALMNSVLLVKNGNSAGAAKNISLGEGKRLMDEIRLRINEMTDVEYHLLQLRADEQHSSLVNTSVMSGAALLCIAAVFAAAFVYIQKDLSGKKKTETVLRSTNIELDDLYHNAPCGYHSLTLDGIVHRMNDTELSWLGYTRDEVIDKMHFAEFLAPGSVAAHHAGLELFKVQGFVHDIEFEMRRKNGNTFWVIVNSTAIKDHDGNIVFTRSTVAENTEQKRSREELSLHRRQLEELVMKRTNELHSQAEQYKILFEGNPLPMWVYAVDTLQILAVNEAATKHYGYTVDEFLTLTVKDLRPPEDVLELIKTFAASNNGMHQGIWRHRKKDGTIISVEIVSHTVRFNGTASRLVLSNDITLRLIAEEQVRQAEQRYRSTLDYMMEGCQIIGFDYRYLYVNDVVAKQGRSAKEDLIGKTMMSMYPGIEQTEMFGYLRRCMEERIPFTMENEFFFSAGEKGWFYLNIEPVPEGVFIISTDITQQKKDEEELLRHRANLEVLVKERTLQLEEANKELESFTYSVSHDLRAPLRHINGYVDLFMRKSVEQIDEKGKHYLTVISESSRRMGELIDDLLIFSRMGKTALTLEQLDMQSIVEETIKNFGVETDGREIEWKVGQLPPLTADRSMMKLVFQNLIGNSVKYSGTKERAVIEIGSVRSEKGTVYSVTDNGVGFDMQYYEKLFGVFQRLHSTEQFQGTGIGLANVHRIITRHGGRVWAESTLGESAAFYFIIPQQQGDLL